MKAKILSAVLLFVTFGFVLANAIYITKAIEYTESKVKNQAEAVLSEQEAIYEDFQKKERFISLTVNHEDLMSVEANFADWIGAARAGSEEDFVIAKSRLLDSLEHLRRLSGISPESIF